MAQRAPQQLDFAIDGVRLSDSLQTFPVPNPERYGLEMDDLLSVVDPAWPELTISSLRQLAGVEERSDAWPLEPGRLPLYVCCMCADLGCGALTVAVDFDEDVVRWSDYRLEDGRTAPDETIDLSAFPTAEFDRADYTTTLLVEIPALTALVAEESAARHAYKRQGLRGLFRRLTSRAGD